MAPQAQRGGGGGISVGPLSSLTTGYRRNGGFGPGTIASQPGFGFYAGARNVAGSSSSTQGSLPGKYDDSYPTYASSYPSIPLVQSLVAFGSINPETAQTDIQLVNDYRVNAGYETTFYNYSTEFPEYSWSFEGGTPSSELTNLAVQSVNVEYDESGNYIARLQAGIDVWEMQIEVLESPYALLDDPVASRIRRLRDATDTDPISGETLTYPVYEVQVGMEVDFSAQLFGDAEEFGWVFDDMPNAGTSQLVFTHDAVDPNGDYIVTEYIATFYAYNTADGFSFHQNAEGNFDLSPIQPGAGAWYSDIKIRVVDNSVPTPEPATLLILGSTLIGVLGIRRRRKFFSNNDNFFFVQLIFVKR